MTSAGRVLGYALAQRQGDAIVMDYFGRLFDTPQEARDDEATQVSDLVVAVCEVTK